MLFVHRAEWPGMPLVALPAARIEFARLLFSGKMRLTVFVLLRCRDLLLQFIQRFACGSPEQLIGGGFAVKVIDGAVEILARAALVGFDIVRAPCLELHD